MSDHTPSAPSPLPLLRHANIIAENLRRIDAALPLYPLPPKSLRGAAPAVRHAPIVTARNEAPLKTTDDEMPG